MMISLLRLLPLSPGGTFSRLFQDKTPEPARKAQLAPYFGAGQSDRRPGTAVTATDLRPGRRSCSGDLLDPAGAQISTTAADPDPGRRSCSVISWIPAGAQISAAVADGRQGAGSAPRAKKLLGDLLDPCRRSDFRSGRGRPPGRRIRAQGEEAAR